MVPRRDHCAHAVDARGQATGNLSLEGALAVALVINTLEVGELGRVGHFERAQAADILDRDVAVTDDVAALVQVLRRRVVVGAGVD